MNWIISSTPLQFLTMSLWRDEAFSYMLASQPFFRIFSLTAKDFNPPLYYLILHVYMYIFGHSEIALRALSLMFYYGTVYISYLFITRIFNIHTRMKWVYLAIIAGNPFLIYYAMEARMYSMSAFLAILSWYYLLSHRPRRYMAAVIVGLYTHYFFMLLIASQVMYVLSSRVITWSRKRSYIGDLLKCALAYVPWVVCVLLNRPPVEKEFWILSPTIYTILNTPAVLILGYEEMFQFPAFSLIPTTVIWATSAVTSLRVIIAHVKTRDMIRALIAWAFVPAVITIILSPIKPLFLPRYLIVSTPGILLMLVFVLHVMPSKTMRYVLMIALLAVSIQYHSLQLQHRTKDNIRGVISEIKTLHTKDDLLYVDNELNYHLAQYYYDPTRVYIYNKSYDEIPAYVGRVLIPRSSVASSLPHFPQRAFILHSDMSYDIQSTF